MSLRLFNTLTKTKEDFAPIDPANVRMYVCGPTVYDFAHIGNARPVIVFDVLFRLLRHVYGDAHVTYARNITDVDDKINARAAERGISIRELTEETARIYEEDVAALGNLPPSVTPRATEHIAQMIRIIEQLVAAGHAYAADGHVLFDVSSKADYGKLSRRSLDEMLAGARVEVAPYKKNAMDFVLWKPSEDALPGWESPWGRGRPGWHIECSAMAGEYLGETFDIHGGGIDLQFPHHENEIAQSEGAHHGHPLAKVWMHNGFLQVEGEKMSKSLGNFYAIREILETSKFGGRAWNGEVCRLAMLQTHYRQPIDWTVKILEQSETQLARWREFASRRFTSHLDKSIWDDFVAALSDDLNTPAAISIIERAVKVSRPINENYTVFRMLRMLGFKGPSSVSLKLSGVLSEEFSQLRSQLVYGNQESLSADIVVALAALEKSLQQLWPKIDPLGEVPEVEKFAHSLSDDDFSKKESVKYWDSPRHFETLKSCVRDIDQISDDGWSNIVGSISRQPRLKGGNLKSMTKLVALLKAWRRFFERDKPKVLADFSSLLAHFIELRNVARKNKDFAESDRIRDALLAKGVVLKDGPQGTTWEMKK